VEGGRPRCKPKKTLREVAESCWSRQHNKKKRHWKATVMIDSEWLNVIHKTVALSSYGYGNKHGK